VREPGDPTFDLGADNRQGPCRKGEEQAVQAALEKMAKTGVRADRFFWSGRNRGGNAFCTNSVSPGNGAREETAAPVVPEARAVETAMVDKLNIRQQWRNPLVRTRSSCSHREGKAGGGGKPGSRGLPGIGGAAGPQGNFGDKGAEGKSGADGASGKLSAGPK
jgi:hypothetical protein